MTKGLTKYFFAAAVSIFFIGVTLDPLNHVDSNNLYNDTNCEWCALEVFQPERLDAPATIYQQVGLLAEKLSGHLSNQTFPFSARAPPKNTLSN